MQRVVVVFFNSPCDYNSFREKLLILFRILFVSMVQVDSVPAVFGITEDPFIVFSSNIFAILGLRSIFSILAEAMESLP